MWTCLCIAFGCWAIALAGGMQTHATVTGGAPETQMSDSGSKDSANSSGSTTTLDGKSDSDKSTKSQDTTTQTTKDADDGVGTK